MDMATMDMDFSTKWWKNAASCGGSLLGDDTKHHQNTWRLVGECHHFPHMFVKARDLTW